MTENETKQPPSVRASELPPVLALAYLGDAYHALWTRRLLVSRGITTPGGLNRAAADFVTAETQARAFALIEELLTEEERDLCRRARNNNHLNGPRRVSRADYRNATALEALLGMLCFIGNEARAEALLSDAIARGYGSGEDDK